MIPKNIIYIWFGKGEKGNLIQQCIDKNKQILEEWDFKNLRKIIMIYLLTNIWKKRIRFKSMHLHQIVRDLIFCIVTEEYMLILM